MDQDKDRFGYPFEGKGQKYGGEDKVGKNQEDEEIGGGMCPGCYRKEEGCS